MQEKHLRHSGSTYSVCGSFTKKQIKNKKIKEKVDSG